MLLIVVCALVALGLQAPADAADDVHPEWGSTSAPDAVLKRGCKDYTYSYQVTPPEGQWSLELFFKGPSGKRVGSAYFLSGGDPLADTEVLELCRSTTRTGRFTIRAFLSVQTLDDDEATEGWLPESHFRLHRPRR
jgi:hypothetical protein